MNEKQIELLKNEIKFLEDKIKKTKNYQLTCMKIGLKTV